MLNRDVVLCLIVTQYYVSQICSVCRNHNPVLLTSSMIYHRIFHNGMPTGATIGAETVFTSGVHEFYPSA
jgi:hypothetical protein